MAKIAIIQHGITFGGRLSVILSIISYLNERGLVPEIVTSRAPSSEDIQTRYGQSVRFTLRKLSFPPLPTDLDIFQFNLRVRRQLERYDLVINTSNSGVFLPESIPLIQFVFFPRKARAASSLYSIHLPEMRHSRLGPRSLYKHAARWLYGREKISPDAEIITISEFVREATLQAFPIARSRVHVIYPPVDLSEFRWNRGKERSIVTLGRFTRYKRQHEQLAIAKTLSDIPFSIMGFVTDRGYFRECDRLRTQMRLENARLIEGAPFHEIRARLERSTVFLHNVIDEPFGLTTVQAIAAGCVPVVHDSGGQREIVPVPGLRFRTPEEAVGAIRYALDPKDRERMSENLREHVASSFSESEFRSRFDSIVGKLL